MGKSLFEGVEWAVVAKRLTAYACTLVPPQSPIKGLGTGPEDLVNETLERLWDPESRVRWNQGRYGKPTTDSVTGFLVKVLRNHFLDVLKSAAHTRSVDPPAIEQPSEWPGLAQSDRNEPEHVHALRIYLREVIEQLMPSLDADPEVAVYLDLQVNEGGPYSNAEAAELLGVSSSDIVNLKKRLERHVTKLKRVLSTASAQSS